MIFNEKYPNGREKEQKKIEKEVKKDRKRSRKEVEKREKQRKRYSEFSYAIVTIRKNDLHTQKSFLNSLDFK